MTYDLLSVNQAAKLIGRPQRTLMNWLHTGKVRGIKVGGVQRTRYVIERSEIDRIIDERLAELHAEVARLESVRTRPSSVPLHHIEAS